VFGEISQAAEGSSFWAKVQTNEYLSVMHSVVKEQFVWFETWKKIEIEKKIIFTIGSNLWLLLGCGFSILYLLLRPFDSSVVCFGVSYYFGSPSLNWFAQFWLSFENGAIHNIQVSFWPLSYQSLFG
jgi:hypothetical protein